MVAHQDFHLRVKRQKCLLQVPTESTAQLLSFEWSHNMVLSTDSKIRNILFIIKKKYSMKLLVGGFHLNGSLHTRVSSIDSNARAMYRTINSTTWKYCSATFNLMGALQGVNQNYTTKLYSMVFGMKLTDYGGYMMEFQNFLFQNCLISARKNKQVVKGER